MRQFYTISDRSQELDIHGNCYAFCMVFYIMWEVQLSNCWRIEVKLLANLVSKLRLFLAFFFHFPTFRDCNQAARYNLTFL